MQPYRHDTAPPSLGGKGKSKAVLVIGEPASSQQLPSFPRQATNSRPRVSHHTFSRPQSTVGKSQTAGNLSTCQDRDPVAYRTSTTWTSSSGDFGLISEDDEVEDRGLFVDEYNKLSKKHGIRSIVPGDFPPAPEPPFKSLPERKTNWISRVLRQTSNGQTVPHTAKPPDRLQHRRSISDIALNFVHNQRKAALKHEDLRGLVRLCGRSTLYLPSEYATGSLTLPTCFRATAHYLIQHAESQGIFRIPGSVRIVNALYDYYCADESNEDIATTTRCPNLPTHLNCSVHDVASTFKRFLSVLPGGILGSLSLFDALVAIRSQLHADPESTITKESKLRARLIALAIGTVKSRYRRELICAVFGILCLVGRVAELAPREDAKGRPLPTFDLMGYNALAIIFGPLLVGDLLNSYSMKVADPAAGLVLLPLTPPKSKRHKRNKAPKNQMPPMLSIDRIHVANDITEMLIVHWREVVRQLRSMSAIHLNTDPLYSGSRARSNRLNSSASESFSMRRPPDWSAHKSSNQVKFRSDASIADSPTPSSKAGPSKARMTSVTQMEPLPVRRQRVQTSSSAASHRFPRGHSLNALTPTAEESSMASQNFSDHEVFDRVATSAPDPYQIKTDNGLEQAGLAGNTEALRTQSCDFQRNPVSSAPASDSVMPGTSVQPSKSLDGTGTNSQRQPYENPHELDAETHLDSPSALHDKTEKQRATSTNSTQELASRVPSRAPSTGNTPLKYERLPSMQEAITALPPSPTEGQMLAPEQQLQSKHSAENMDDENLTNLAYTSDTIQPIASESEEISPPSGVERFPSFHKSVVENTKSSTEDSTDHGHTSKKRTDQASSKSMSPDKSSPWSLRHILGRKSPSAGHADKKAERLTGAPATKSSYVNRWKELVKNSPTSPLGALREKRLFRGAGHASPHQSVDSKETVKKKKADTLEGDRKLITGKLEDQKKPAALSPDKKIIFEKSSQSSSIKPNTSPTKGKAGSPANAATNVVNRTLSQRSSSRPVEGAVKAMAALFDNASLNSPDGHTLTGRSHSGHRSSDSFASKQTNIQSPAKSTKSVIVPSTVMPQTPSMRYTDDPRGTGIASGRIYRTSGRRKQSSTDHSLQDTPSKVPKVALRPTGFTFTAVMDEPRVSPSYFLSREQELSHPPSLGTMVPYREEPPVAQHLNLVRPPSGSSSYSHLSSQPLGDDVLITPDTPLPTYGESAQPRSGSGLLHAQIRRLHRQLQSKNEEVLHLRRQLEAREDMDIGTLSEQLRQAKRECAMWRDRAEAAEKRVAVFQRFATKARALRCVSSDKNEKIGDRNQEEARSESNMPTRRSTERATLGSESDGTEHTEDQEAFNSRIRTSMDTLRRNTGQSTWPGNDGAISTPPDNEATLDLNLEKALEVVDFRGMSRRTRALWMATEELLGLQDEMDSRL